MLYPNILKDLLQILVDTCTQAQAWRKEGDNNTVSLQIGRDLSPVPFVVVPISKGELRLINVDPYHQQDKGPVSVTTRGEVMWIHPNLVEDQQYTAVTKEKSKMNSKTSSCNVITPFPKEDDTHVPIMTDSDEGKNVLTTEQEVPSGSGTRSGKKYDQATGGPVENP